MSTVGLFAVSLALIVVASELFTNAVEWAGYRLHLGSGATGSLLAALGTALPETVVPIVAVAGRRPDADEVAIGAIVGAPFLLFTLGLGITGVAVIARRQNPVLQGDAAQIRRDLRTFAGGFLVLAVAVVLPLWPRVACAGVLAVLYGLHIRATLRGGDASTELPEPLHLVRHRGRDPRRAEIAVQLVGAVTLLVISADLFVRALEDAAAGLGISALVLALVLVPLATELPETMNSVLWVRSRDDVLALGNVLGATAFQACVPGAVGLCFTSWRPGPAGLLNGGVTALAAGFAFAVLRRGRCGGGWLALAVVPWVAYVVVVAVSGSRLAQSG